MARAMEKNSSPSKDHSNDDTDTQSFLVEEHRLRHSERGPSKKSTTQFNTLVNQMTSEQLDVELQKRRLSISGNFQTRRVRLKHDYRTGSKAIEQHFEYIAVLDFEATCEENAEKDYQHEIIEFPIVLINVREQTIIDTFQSYCRPVKRPILSKFCTELSAIEQHQVNAAPTFSEVLQNVEAWLNERNLLSSTNKPRFAFATDGPWDFDKFLQLQCHTSSIPYPRWAEEWIDLRKEFARFYSERSCGIAKMLVKLGLSFDGRPHSGIDDATNIARIILSLLKDGCVLSINDRVCRSDDPLTEEKSEFNNSEEKDDDVVFQS